MPVRDRFGPLMEGREGLRAKNAKSSVASKYGVELFESEGAEHGITEVGGKAMWRKNRDGIGL